MYFTHFVRKRASSRTTDSAGSAEGAESVESVVESVGSQILLRTLVLSARTASARHGIAVWDQVPRAGVVRDDVASLPAPSRAAGSATARKRREVLGHAKIDDFRASQVATLAI